MSNAQSLDITNLNKITKKIVFYYKMHTIQKEGNNMAKFNGKASRLSWELFKRTGKINYYLLYKNIETAPELEQNNYADRDDGRGM